MLKQRVENLKAKTESKDESKADDAFYTREAEITEIESLIPEIQEKIQDTKDMKEQEKDPKEESGFSGNEIFFFCSCIFCLFFYIDTVHIRYINRLFWGGFDTLKNSIKFFSGAGKSDAKPISSISVKRKADGDNASPTKKAHVENGN